MPLAYGLLAIGAVGFAPKGEGCVPVPRINGLRGSLPIATLAASKLAPSVGARSVQCLRDCAATDRRAGTNQVKNAHWLLHSVASAYRFDPHLWV